MRFKLLPTLLLLAVVLPALAETPSFQMRSFTTELSQSHVLAIAQDHNGYIYMATRNGLCRYDGQEFRHFKSYPGDACRLSNDRINELYVSPKNYIWCITHDYRCYLFDPAQGQFFDPLAGMIGQGERPPRVEWIYPLENGVTWVACRGAAYRIEEELFNKDFTGGGIVKYPIGAGGFAGTRVEKIRLDREGNEWLLTDQSVHTIGTTKQTPQRGRSYICPTDEGVYIVEHHGRLSYYAPEVDRPHTVQLPDAHGIVRNIQQIGRDTLGIATDRGLTIYYAAQERFHHIPVRGGDVRECFRDRRGNLWLYTDESGVFRYELQTEQMHWYQTAQKDMPKDDKGSMIFWHEDSRGRILLTPHDGALSYYNPEQDRIEPLRSVTNRPYRRVARRYFIDKQENLWIAEVTGISRLTLRSHAFRHIELGSGETKGMLFDQKGRIWITARDKTIRLFDKQQQLIGYLAPDGRLHDQPVPFEVPIYCLHEDRDGTIWMGSRYGGLYRLCPIDDTRFRLDNFRHDPKDAYSLNNDHIYDILRDRHGRLWIGSYDGGLNLVEEEQSDRPRFLHGLNRLPYPQQAFAQIRTLEEVGDYLFVGTTSGLVVVPTLFDKAEEVHCYTYRSDQSRTDGLLSNDIRDIYYAPTGELYLLAFSGGLSRIIPERSTPERLCCENLTRKEGLPSEQVLAMVGTAKSHLHWIITETGLYQFAPATRHFDTFGSYYSNNKHLFSEAKPLLVEDHLLIGTSTGYCSTPAKPAISHFVPQLLLSELRINNEVHRNGIDHLRTLRLEPDQRHLQLNFTALDFSNSEAIRYAYRFRRNNKAGEWLQLGHQHSLSLHDLDAGTFAVDIRSTNSDGVWVDNTITLQITVAPTFWESRWVWLLWGSIALVVVLILTMILHLRAKVAMEQQLSNTKLRFYTNISHELRTPLTLITAPIDLLLSREQLTPEGRSELQIVRKNTRRLIHTINQILDFRKIESHKMRLLLEQGDLFALLRQTMSHFDLLAAEHHIDYRFESPVEQFIGWFDRDKLEKILFNLLSNAFKYTPDGRRITLRATPIEGQLRIEVIDEGQGIDEAMRKQLFVRFETLMRANLFKASSGIGLSLVHELVTLHGGTIRVESEVNKGSSFIVTLPTEQQHYAAMAHADFLLEDQPRNTEQPATADLAASFTTQPEEELPANACEDAIRLRILLIEDNDELRTMMRNILQSEYVVYEAADGLEGLELAREQQPDLVISDIIMPHMDGLELVRTLKSDPNTSHLSILLLSAKSSLDDRIQGLEHGVDDYLPKPFHASYLLARIRSLITRRHELQQRLLSQMVADDITQTDPEEYITPEVRFLRQATAVVEAHLDDEDWSIDPFATELCISHTVLYQKLKSAVGLSPIEFIREVRLKKACQLIREGHHNIASISYMVGFSDPKYFTRVFKKRFGTPPSQYPKKGKR